MLTVTAAGGGGRAKSPKQLRNHESFKNHAAALSPEARQRADHAAEEVRHNEEMQKKTKQAWEEKFRSIAKELELSDDETKRRYLLIEGKGGVNLNLREDLGVANHVKYKEELQFRKCMLNLARSRRKGGNRLNVGKSDRFVHDPNTDKLLDFIIRPEDGGTLAHLSQKELQSRVSVSNSAALCDARAILDYICGENIQRRFYWVKAGKEAEDEAARDLQGERTRRSAKDPGYCSNHLQDKDRNTSEWGYYIWKTKQFIPWVPVNREDLEPFLDALYLMDQYVDQMKETEKSKDHAGHATNTATKTSKHPDARFLQQQIVVSSKAQRVSSDSYVREGVLRTASQFVLSKAEKAILENVRRDNIVGFEHAWNQFARHLELGSRSKACMNEMFEIVRDLFNSNALVFSDRGGHRYEPTSFLTFRSLDDHLSHADERLRSLVMEYGLTDSDGKIDVATNKKVFHTQAMKDAGIPAYELPPYAFCFDTKTKVLKLAEGGSENLMGHYRHLRLPIARSLDALNKQYAFSPEELLERSKDPNDPIYGDVTLHPLIAPFCDVSLIQEEVLCKRASFEDLADDSFPFPDKLFLDVSFPHCNARLVSNGRRNGCYIKYGASKWKRAELTDHNTEITIAYASEEDLEYDGGKTDEAAESSEDDEYTAASASDKDQEAEDTQQ